MEHLDFTAYKRLFVIRELFQDRVEPRLLIANGTPKLSLVFQLSSDFHKGKSHTVGDTGFEPVTPAM